MTAALGSSRTLKLTEGVLASDKTQRGLHHVASSPELRDAIARQTTGLAEEVLAGVRASAGPRRASPGPSFTRVNSCSGSCLLPLPGA